MNSGQFDNSHPALFTPALTAPGDEPAAVTEPADMRREAVRAIASACSHGSGAVLGFIVNRGELLTATLVRDLRRRRSTS